MKTLYDERDIYAHDVSLVQDVIFVWDTVAYDFVDGRTDTFGKTVVVQGAQMTPCFWRIAPVNHRCLECSYPVRLG